MPRSCFVLASFLFVLALPSADAAKVKVWHQHTQAHYDKATFQQAGVREFAPELSRHWAEALLRMGQAQEAEQYAREAEQAARDLSMQGEMGMALRGLGEALVAQARVAEATAVFTQSVTVLAEVGNAYELARSRLALAQLLAAQAKRAEAQKLVAQALAVFEPLGAMLDLATAHALRDELAKDS